ncbi:uncharacterized protein TM35_000351630 [Trypanosoma theileri]|uniref:Uncharacterized protein n=1 Tax=Trypanosoma theileri TaxID=67003 RepID=A0A1X0NMP8_9TRYP|nr:uncharacterized protein TM35_000351630 [Trypanosoma theileri]ORC85419.1 hypothetical protein TM35_000351630 [Trypanosoma theileri]
MNTEARASRICTKGTFSRLDTPTKHRGILPITCPNGNATHNNRKCTGTRDTTTPTARNLPIVTSPSGNDIKKRVYVNSSALSRSVHRGAGIRGQPHRKGHVDPHNMGTTGFHTTKIHTVYSAEKPRHDRRKYSATYRKFAIGKNQRDSIYAHTDRHDGVRENDHSNVFNGLAKNGSTGPVKTSTSNVKMGIGYDKRCSYKGKKKSGFKTGMSYSESMGRNNTTPKTKFRTARSRSRCHNSGLGVLPKTLKSDPHRAARYAVIGEDDARRVKTVEKEMEGDEKFNDNNHKRDGKYSSPLRNDSSLHKERSIGPRRGRSGRTQSRSTIANSAGETCRPHGTLTQHGTISRPLGRNNKQASTPDITDVSNLEKWATASRRLPQHPEQGINNPFK